MTDWQASIINLAGIGPKSYERFAKLGITTIQDLFFHFPFRYEDVGERDIATILDEEKVTLKGTVITMPTVSYFGRRKSRLQFKLAVTDSAMIQIVFFNQPYLSKQVDQGDQVAIYGKWQEARQTLLGIRLISQAKLDQGVQSIYRLTQGLKQNQVVKAIEQAFQDYGHTIQEMIPHYCNEHYHLMGLDKALYQMHFPDSDEDKRQAQRKIIYQEFFLYQWQLQIANQQIRQSSGIQVPYDVEELKRIIDQLPYELTQAQKRGVNDICYDLLAPYPMLRLLQGDVGSGKTLVAFLAMIATVQAGFQAVLMVPTEILAQQHYEQFNDMLEPLGLHADLFISAMQQKDKRQVMEGLETGQIPIVIGTHALIQPTVKFAHLALVIIDEQHRFGVGQRQALFEKVASPLKVNILQMTATPIPRSLAMTLYGQMAVSTIDELPSGRQPIQTFYLASQDISRCYKYIYHEISHGHQVYYVLPMIDTSEELDQVESVESVYQRLSGIFPTAQIGKLHGQMTKDDQRSVMQDFMAGDIDIIIATTMVEVGVNVPNATIMVIQSAERFGLAQLHQLRGRVGRSNLPSYCFLIANPTTDQGKKRMQVMVESQDGFYISEEDLKLRGMGDLLGRDQSGLPQFHYANLIEDQHIHQVAKKDVAEILAGQIPITNIEREMLTNYVNQHMIEL